jgi:ketosteroid isomerase-like protein
MTKFVNFLLFMFLLGILGCQKAVNLEAEEEKISTLLNQWVVDVAEENLAAVSAICAHTDDLILVDQYSNEVHGWDWYEKYLLEFFARAENINFDITRQKIKIAKSGDMAWFFKTENISFISGEDKIFVEGMRASGVLEKIDGNWLVVHIHPSFITETNSRLN